MFPNPISSGTNSILTIQGFGFGATRGSGQIWLKNNKGGNDTIKHFDYIDYVSWSDTEIKFKVPSRVDTLSSGLSLAPGSGIVTVKRDDGATGQSTAAPTPILDINFANLSSSSGAGTPQYEKVPRRLIDPTPNDSDTGMIFYLHTSITADPAKEAAIRKALHDWSCATLVNWEIKGDTNITAQNAADGINLIFIDNNLHGSPVAVASPQAGAICTDANGDKVVYVTDVDISFSVDFTAISSGTGYYVDTNLTNNVPTGLFDFYLIAQHEIGHAHGLGHVNDNIDVMYFSGPPGPIVSANRHDLFGSSDAILGGDYVVSKSIFLTTCTGVGPMIPASSQFCAAVGLDQLFNKDIELLAYPNPASDLLNLSFKIERNANIKISLYNHMGKHIQTLDKGVQHIKYQNIQMDVNDVSTGLYFVMVQIDDRVEIVKLIIN